MHFRSLEASGVPDGRRCMDGGSGPDVGCESLDWMSVNDTHSLLLLLLLQSCIASWTRSSSQQPSDAGWFVASFCQVDTLSQRAAAAAGVDTSCTYSFYRSSRDRLDIPDVHRDYQLLSAAAAAAADWLTDVVHGIDQVTGLTNQQH